jgi:hypothetical protein
MKVYIIINFKTCEVNQDIRKLTQISILIIIIIIKRIIV